MTAQGRHETATGEPVALEASATSGLPVEFSVKSGPASFDGDLLVLDGEAGTGSNPLH